MTFLVIPAIDLKGGRCVRLRQGRMEEETVYSSDPVAVAKRWEEAGASWIHAVDLDGALEGRSVNEEAVREILKGVGCKVQLGGGIRDLEAIERWLSVGVKRVVLGTVACERPEVVREAVLEFGERIAVGIDAKEGEVMVRGWTKGAGRSALDLAKEMEGYGVSLIVYTDVKRDGMGTGLNLKEAERMARELSIPLILSGGASSLEEIRRARELSPLGVKGVIVGRALYEGLLDLKEAIRVAQV